MLESEELIKTAFLDSLAPLSLRLRSIMESGSVRFLRLLQFEPETLDSKTTWELGILTPWLRHLGTLRPRDPETFILVGLKCVKCVSMWRASASLKTNFWTCFWWKFIMFQIWPSFSSPLPIETLSKLLSYSSVHLKFICTVNTLSQHKGLHLRSAHFCIHGGSKPLGLQPPPATTPGQALAASCPSKMS